MIERVIVRRLAKQDIREARKWYRKISPLLGDDFTVALNRAIAVVREHPSHFKSFIARSGVSCFTVFRMRCSIMRRRSALSLLPCSISRVIPRCSNSGEPQLARRAVVKSQFVA